MNEAPEIPLVFAHRVIQQFVDHLIGPDIKVEDAQFAAMQQVFRRCGGSWERLVGGDLVHTLLIEVIVTAWGAMQKPTK